MSRKSGLSTLSLILIVIAAVNCNNDKQEAVSPDDISSPPSLKSNVGQMIVELSDSEANRLNIETLTVRKDILEIKIDVPGIVVPSHDHYAVVSSPISGIVSALFYHEGEAVKEGENLLELESMDYANLVADFVESYAELKYLNIQSDQLKKLSDEKITSEQAFNKVLADQSRVKARYETLKNRLKLLDVTDEELQNWGDNPWEAPASLMIKSPIKGRIHEHYIDLGQPVKAYDKMMDVLDPVEVIVKGYFSPDDVKYVQEGDSLWVYGKRNQSDLRHVLTKGTVSSINPALDDENRSVYVNSHIKAVNGRPAAGEQVSIEYSVSTSDSLIQIPQTCLIYDADQPGVFVKVDDNKYVFRPIDILRMSDEFIIMSSGLSAGEQVVINQVFSLKALLRFEIFAE